MATMSERRFIIIPIPFMSSGICLVQRAPASIPQTAAVEMNGFPGPTRRRAARKSVDRLHNPFNQERAF
jgi:hypothetical protein